MKFRNPWIDPRVEQVRSAAAQAYLLGHGWKALPIEQPNLLPFESALDEETPVILVPVIEEARDYPQRIVEFITELALAEGRYAVEVLNDILQQSSLPISTNGPSTPVQPESAVR